MVHPLVFRRNTDPASPDFADNYDPLANQRGIDWPAGLEADFRRNVLARRAPGCELAPAPRRAGMLRLGRGPALVAGSRPDRDAYLLVLLADQELLAGREEQALSLVEAAYAAFDQHAAGHHGKTAG